MDPALGAVLGEVLNAVINVLETTYMFKPLLKNIKKTLDSLKPEFDQIAESSRLLRRTAASDTGKFKEQLKAGKNLILECSTVEPWDFIKRYKYSRKLTAFHGKLLLFMQMYVQAFVASNTMMLLVGMEGIDDKLYKITEKLSILQYGGGGGYCDVPGLPDFIVGLKKPLKEVKKMILDDGNSVVVVSAPGGTGKTTLSKMLCNDKDIRDKFGKNTFFVMVSQKASLKDIVQKIFQHTGKSIPEFQNTEVMMNQLESLMGRVVETGPILLVLDDVWSEWESYIQKFNFRVANYKILITSRFVFQQFVDHTYILKTLSEKDSMTLFRHRALGNDSPKIPEEIVGKVVKGCKGSPLALTVVGLSLRGWPELTWTKTLKKWSEGSSLFDINKEELLLPLQTSLDSFEENAIAKECFLDLGSFPEDQKIAAALLSDMWIESYGQDDGDIIEILIRLSFRNLLILSPRRKDSIEVDGYCNQRYVTQHDLLRELAIYQSNQESIEQRRRLFLEVRDNSYPKWWIEQQQPNCVRLLSISTDEAFESAWYNLQLPSAEVLILNFNSKYYKLPPFIEAMNKLKVIIITNYGSFREELIDFQLLKHLYNLKRIRLEHVSIASLATSLTQLNNLQKISLMMCQISKAFHGCTSEATNIFPNLTELELDYCDDLVEFPIGLCNLLKLEKLRMSHCSELIALPDEFGRLVTLDMLMINYCTEMKKLPESICELHNLTVLDISGCTRMTSLPKQIGKLENLKVLLMRGCIRIQDLPDSVKDLTKLKNVVCDEEILDLWKAYQSNNMDVSVVKEDVDLDWLPSA